MSALDIAILAIVAASTLYGLFRGGTKEIFTILAILLGIVGGIYLHRPLGSALGGSAVAYGISFVVILLVIAFVLDRIGRVIRAILKWMFLGSIDRLVGAGIGFVRGMAIVCLILGMVATYVEDSKQWMKDSILALPALKVAEILSPAFPEELDEQFERRYREVRDYWKDAKKRK